MTLGTGGIFGYPRSDTGFGGGIFGRSGFPPLLDPETQQAVNQTAAQPMQPSGPNKWIDALQGVGAALRDDPGVYENYQNRQAQQQQFQTRRQDELADYQRRMQDERNNWLFQQDYEAQHPKPASDDFSRAMTAAGIQPGTQEYQNMARQRAMTLSDPTVTTMLPGDRFYSGPRSQMGAALGGVAAQQQPPQGGAPSGSPLQRPRTIAQRPAGLSNDQLMAQAHEAVRAGANVEEVFRQLQAWGVNP